MIELTGEQMAVIEGVCGGHSLLHSTGNQQQLLGQPRCVDRRQVSRRATHLRRGRGWHCAGGKALAGEIFTSPDLCWRFFCEWGFPKIEVPPNHPKLDHLSIETHGVGVPNS